MAQLDLTDDEREILRDNLDMQIEGWEEQLEQICMQPFDTWEELLNHSAFSEEVINALKKAREQLRDERDGASETV
jgi:hypothetical protein